MPWWLGLALAAVVGSVAGAFAMALACAADDHRVIAHPETPGWVTELYTAMALVPDGVALRVQCASCLQPVRYWYDVEQDPHPGMLGGWEHQQSGLNFDHPPRPYVEARRKVDELGQL
jgi:hypothetical protein